MVPGRRSQRSRPTLRPGTVKAERVRLARRLKSMSKHRRALDAAIAEFGSDLDPSLWEAAFSSNEPKDTNRVLAVTGGYSILLNNYVEMLRAGARLAGIVSGRRPNAETCFAAVRDDGGLSSKQAELLRELYGIEGRIEHASPDVQADEVRDAIRRLRAELSALVEQAVAWLARHDIDLTDPPAQAAKEV